ncbi:MAG: YbdD/YjiX family protein [Gallionella sp.]|nr:YbdD/YjiX family protein [Gallionella sp.]
MAKGLSKLLRLSWRILRQLSGDDGYERYLAHHAAVHPGALPLSRSAWFASQQQKKWTGVKRCC